MPAELRRFRASDTDWLVEQHHVLYAADEGFDDSFAGLVRDILTEFSADHDPQAECGWIACDGVTRLGSIFCVRHDETTAKLRLFLLVPEARGQGLGRQLLEHCMEFARGAGYAGMTLWTHESHRAACALYEAAGWALIHSKPAHSFGCDVIEQTWTIKF